MLKLWVKTLRKRRKLWEKAEISEPQVTGVFPDVSWLNNTTQTHKNTRISPSQSQKAKQIVENLSQQQLDQNPTCNLFCRYLVAI